MPLIYCPSFVRVRNFSHRTGPAHLTRRGLEAPPTSVGPGRGQSPAPTGEGTIAAAEAEEPRLLGYFNVAAGL